jgi:hypothetical protein
MIHDIVLRWVVTGLFALTAVEFGVAVITKPRPSTMHCISSWLSRWW